MKDGDSSAFRVPDLSLTRSDRAPSLGLSVQSHAGEVPKLDKPQAALSNSHSGTLVETGIVAGKEAARESVEFNNQSATTSAEDTSCSSFHCSHKVRYTQLATCRNFAPTW